MSFSDFFENLFFAPKPQADAAAIQIEGEQLTFTRNGHAYQQDFGLLRCITGTRPSKDTNTKWAGLWLTFENTRIYVPSFSDGFQDLLYFLQKRWQVDPQQLARLQTEKPDFQWLIWQRYGDPNVRIENTDDPEALRKDFWLGFRLHDAREKLFTWDTSIEQWMALPFVEKLPVGTAQTTALRLHTPIMWGNVMLDQVEIQHLPQRWDVPPTYYFGHLLIDEPGDSNYFLPKKAWVALFGLPTFCTETEQQLFSSWKWEEFDLTLSYYYDSSQAASTGTAHVSLTNQRMYPEHWLDEAYENTYELTQRLYLPKAFYVKMDWRNNPFARPIPEGMQREAIYPDKPFLIWRDERNGRIGFTNAVNAVIIPTEKLLALERRVWAPDKGEASETLYALVDCPPAPFWVALAEGNYEDFKPLVAEIGRFLGMEVGFSDPWRQA